MVENARYIANAVDVPLICDADTGYGNPINVWRTVREYEKAGAAAIHIEDQVFPKRCGFLKGKAVMPLEEQVEKIKAALDARQDRDFIIIARSDALSIDGWDGTVRRCRAYREAGADLIFVDGMRTNEDIETLVRRLGDLPMVYCGGLLPSAEIAQKGFKLMLTGSTTMIIYQALKTAFGELKDRGTLPVGIAGIPEGPMAEEINRVRGMPLIKEMEKRYRVGNF
jgi:2,3-dimethylmalate lyase